jgi:uncharacterized membrane protein YjgN (DUF898 family)
MTEQEAFEILGLKPGASAEKINRAHRELMKKLHPDQGGTAFLTSQVDEARKTLLGEQPAGLQTAPPASPGTKVAHFLGHDRDYWRLLIRGNVLVMVTLGIYRFWLATDMRRFLWANTDVAGESFEYTGTARELLIGFLFAIAILVPLYSIFFIAALGAGPIGEMSGLFSFVLLTLLGHYAVYRARRYRLTRTVYRGVRFLQEGSAWRYAVCALFWWTLVILTVGLAYPFAQSRLERFKMRYTSFGNLAGRFEGSALSLFLRGILMWFLAVVPLTVGLFQTFAAIDWTMLANAKRVAKDDIVGWIEASGLANAVVLAGLTLIWVLVVLAILYPIFQAMMLRWWTSGLRFGEIVVTSRLKTAQVFGIYARFLWYAFLFSLAAAAIGLGCLYVFDKVIGHEESLMSEIAATAALLAGYVIVMLGYSTIYQATVKLGLWRCVTESLDVANIAALERVKAAGRASSPIGEGLADALNVGGI